MEKLEKPSFDRSELSKLSKDLASDPTCNKMPACSKPEDYLGMQGESTVTGVKGMIVGYYIDLRYKQYWEIQPKSLDGATVPESKYVFSGNLKVNVGESLAPNKQEESPTTVV